MIPNRLLVLLLAAAVCSAMACNSDSKDAPKPVEQHADRQKQTPSPADVASASKPDGEVPEDPAAVALKRILPTLPHEMPQEIADVVLTQTELAAVDEKYHRTGASLPTAEQIKLVVDELLSRNIKRDGKVNVVRLELPREFNPTSVISAAWGAGQEGPDNSGVLIGNKPLMATYWFDAERGIRTKLVEAGPQWHITWTSYYPVERLLGSVDGQLGIESEIGVMGRTPQEVAKDLQAPFEVGTDKAAVYLATPEFGGLPVVLRLKLTEDGKISSWKTTIEMGFEAFGNGKRNELEEVFGKHLGDPTKTDAPRRLWSIGEIEVAVGPTPGLATALELEVAPIARP